MKRTLPDGFVGAVMAVESISDAVAFLHGPGGCRVRFMVHSGAVLPRVMIEDTDGCYIPYFYGYPRVPATYLDEYDYINGAFYKVEEGLPIVDGRGPRLIVVINSPGAALIGDNHHRAIAEAGLQDRAIYMDESLVSVPMTEGYDLTLLRIMEHLDPKKKRTDRDTVNIIGVTVMDKDFKAAVEEFVENIEAMGLRVRAVPGGGSSLDELRDSVNSEYCIVVSPEACRGISEYYESMGLRIIRSDAGAPVGFDAVEEFYRNIAEVTGKDASIPIARIAKARDKVYQKFVGMRYNALRIKGLRFSAAGTASVVRPLTEWLYNYLAVAPATVDVDPGADPAEVRRLRSFLESIDYAQSFGQEPKAGSDIVLCEGITAITMRLRGECRIGIPIGHSTMGLDDVIPRPIYGIQGALYILDEILHGVRGTRSDFPGLQQVKVQQVERRQEHEHDGQGYPREVQVVRQTRGPHSEARVGQRERIQYRLEYGVQRIDREERTAQEGHRKDHEAVERGHARMRLGDKRGGHPQHRERQTAQQYACHRQGSQLKLRCDEQPYSVHHEASQKAPDESEGGFAEDDGREAQGAHHHLVEAPVVEPLDVDPGGCGRER